MVRLIEELSMNAWPALQTELYDVVAGNTVAENLYQKLGYREIYRYWYRVSR